MKGQFGNNGVGVIGGPGLSRDPAHFFARDAPRRAGMASPRPERGRPACTPAPGVERARGDRSPQPLSNYHHLTTMTRYPIHPPPTNAPGVSPQTPGFGAAHSREKNM